MPWSMADKNDASKKITGIACYQNDGNGMVKVQPAFTKDAPNGLPQMKQVKIKGAMVWDDSEMTEFLGQVAKDCFAKIASAPTVDEGKEEIAEDDIPF